MVTPAAGNVVLVRFPFSDLSSSKLRPAIILASAGREDWILCQVTSNPYSDARAVELVDDDFASGSLRRLSYARPSKLFTANISIMATSAGHLSQKALGGVVEATIEILRGSLDI